VRDLLAVTPTGAASIEYVKETGFTNAAAPVSEGVAKPETTITFEVENRPVRTIAHWTQASKQVLDDVARLGAFVDGRLRYGVQLVEDSQVLLGDGTGQNLGGLVPAATAFSSPTGIALDTMADYVGAAIAQLRTIEHEPDGVVLHPNDWQKISQQKGSDGHYLIPGGPFSTAAPILFNKPVALTTAMPQDEFLVGQFAVGAELFEREETVVELSTEDRDNFIKNLVTIRAEERVALAIYRPEAFIHGDFGIVT
jgi:HK97 family phage major capsid protein